MNRKCFIVCLLATIICACTGGTAWHQYQSISQEGWTNTDTLRFNVDTIRQHGNYTTSLCLRIKPDFPYRFITLTLSQRTMPRGKEERKKVTIEVTRRDGGQNGNGITYRTHEVPLFTNNIGPGDSLQIKVWHNMSREEMPGIADVGVKVKIKE